MKKEKIKWLPCLLSAAALVSAVGCGSSQGDGTPFYPVEPDDADRTQLYVYNSADTYDIAWLTSVKERFEEAHQQDTQWENGKQGVQVVLMHAVGDVELTAQDVQESREEVYFAQNADYHALRKAGVLAEITTLSDPSNGSEPLVARLTDEQKAYFAEADGVEKYYALPDHSGSVGIVYNVDLFEEKGYYFAQTPGDDGVFVSSNNLEKSYGADGLPETFDDGLPTTYEEFFLLCSYIKGRGDTPIAWGGTEYEKYLTLLAGALATDYEGYEQTMLNYTLTGTAKNLGQIKNGGFVLDGKEQKITPGNGYELARSAGNFYALEFIKRLLDKDNAYYCGDAFKTGYTQADAREDFLTEQEGEEAQAAMLLDGSWWESCVVQTPQPLEAGENTGEDVESATRRMAWLPLPKANEEKVGEERVTVECLRSIAFVKSNVASWKKPLAEEFLQYVYSDEAQEEYVLLTGMEKGLKMGSAFSDPQQSYFSASYHGVQAGTRVVSPCSVRPTFVENERFFAPTEIWRAKFSIAANSQHPAEAFWKKNASVVDYFNALAKHRKDQWPLDD